MSYNQGFPPVCRKDAKILILGSMPGQKSLEENQYYAHPRNAFWPIMFQLLNVESIKSYAQRKRLLIENQIALWDVLKAAYRPGSLDANIDYSTIEANDFKTFLHKHKQIKAVFFNGGEAEKLFKRYVLKGMKITYLEYHRLPSTSPAHAAMSEKQKMMQWKNIKQFIV